MIIILSTLMILVHFSVIRVFGVVQHVSLTIGYWFKPWSMHLFQIMMHHRLFVAIVLISESWQSSQLTCQWSYSHILTCTTTANWLSNTCYDPIPLLIYLPLTRTSSGFILCASMLLVWLEAEGGRRNDCHLFSKTTREFIRSLNCWSFNILWRVSNWE